MTYNEYIDSIIQTRGQWGTDTDSYWEGHHIIPRCLGGEGDPKKRDSNIIRLYPKEHYIAHKLLMEENPDNPKIVAAFSMMAFPKGKTKREKMLSAEEYEEARILFGENFKGEKNPAYGKRPWNYGLTKETDERIKLYAESGSKSKKGIKPPPFTLEHRIHMSEASRRRDWSDFTSHNKGMKAISKDGVMKFISLDDPLPEGWYYGNCKTAGKHDMSNFTEEMREVRRQNATGKNNSMYGKGYLLSGGKNGKAIYEYKFLNKTYDCRIELVNDLNRMGIPISDSTIRQIQKNEYGTCIKNKFQYVIDNLSWKMKEKYVGLREDIYDQ
jgi:hypothetical protein